MDDPLTPKQPDSPLVKNAKRGVVFILLAFLLVVFILCLVHGFQPYDIGYVLLGLALLLVLITNGWLLRWLWSAEVDNYNTWRVTVAQFVFIMFFAVSLLIAMYHQNPYLDCFYKGGGGSYFAIWKDLPAGSGCFAYPSCYGQSEECLVWRGAYHCVSATKYNITLANGQKELITACPT